MAWCWIGDKPLSEPMLIWITDAYAVCGTRGRGVNPVSVSRDLKLDCNIRNLVATEPADGLAPNGAMPSAGKLAAT